MRYLGIAGLWWVLGCGALAAQAAEVDAAKIVREGNAQGAKACAGCHGADGAGKTGTPIPRLAGQNAVYLAKALRDLQQGHRAHPVMGPIAKALSAEEVPALAGYFAALPPPPALEPAPAADLLARGEKLVSSGNPQTGVPACFTCHGTRGQGVGTQFPAIAPQSSKYVLKQLGNFKSGARRNDPNGMMKSVADRLADEEISAVAAYLASRGAR